MESFNEQFFSSEFILNYIAAEEGKKRFLTYITFRFLSFAEETHKELPALLKEKLGCTYTASDFSVVEDFLAADYYFTPTFKVGSFDAVLLYDAICLTNQTICGNTALSDELITTYAPVTASLAYNNPELELVNLLEHGTDFYAALCVAATHYDTDELFPTLLPKFTAAYREEFHFTYEDFILFDFMDEYFEQKNCRQHPSFIELTDTLVAATLNYFNTDFGTMLENELSACLGGTSSRFAGNLRSGSLQLPALTSAEKEKACHRLAELFHYAAIYELRNNLFDFHLEDDKLITLTNWKEKLRWHFVQYSNVYEMTISSFYAAMLSGRMLKQDFLTGISQLCN